MSYFKLSILFIILALTFTQTVFADPIEKVTASITAQNTFTNPITVKESGSKNDRSLGYLGVYVFGTSGDWAGTATLQCAFDYGTAWLDQKSYISTSAPFEPYYINQFEPGVKWRIGIKTGNYTSGTLPVRLSRIK